ncbi:nicotinate phosphoribosyltransferase [Bacteroides nordii]|uniref:nicotinate phosphoribosyltransferase n=1 Tax=Bacteroides nordii TaxID=291645 RepID=UPI0035220190
MMIHTILDTDLYKFTTSYAYIKLFPYAMGTFSFKDRDETVYTEAFLNKLKAEVANLANVALTDKELEYMTRNCRFLPRVYWEWLSSFRFQPEKIDIYLDEEHHLNIEITDYLYKSTLYEVPLLAIVSEIKNQTQGNVANPEEIICKLSEKVVLSNEHQLSFSEFGTRRRFSFDVQDRVISYLKKSAHYCTGTSNCYFAMKYEMKMMGTHPHEWFMFHGAQFGYKHANYMAQENWVNVYDGDLGIALSDTYTSDIFLTNLSRKQAKLFDGVRCDSGNELEFIDKLTARYKELGIDSTTKTIVFSNALDFGKALEIQEYCRGKIRCAFGIGTNLTNDTGFKPSNIVMKLTQCKMNVNQEWRECVKLSDDIGKHIGSPEEVRACLYDLRLG